MAFAATGRPPFGTGAFETIFYRIINGQPDLDGFPAPLVALVAQALSRDPARRPDTAELCRRTAALDPASLVPGGRGGRGGRRRALRGAGHGGGPGPGALADPAPRAAPAQPPPGPRGLAVADQAVGGRHRSRRGQLRREPAAAGSRAARAGQLRRRAASGAVRAERRGRRRLAPRLGPGRRPARTPAARSPAGAAARGGRGRRGGRHRVVLPVAGTVAALIALMALRAGHQTAGRLARRRSRRGARASDALLAAFTFPPALAWSVVRSLLLAPLALVAAAMAAVITIVAAPGHTRAGLRLRGRRARAVLRLRPGFRQPRASRSGASSTPSRTPRSAATAVIAVAAVLVAAVAVAASHSPFFWPVSDLGHWLGHCHVRTLMHDIRNQALRLLGRPGG